MSAPEVEAGNRFSVEVRDGEDGQGIGQAAHLTSLDAPGPRGRMLELRPGRSLCVGPRTHAHRFSKVLMLFM